MGSSAVTHCILCAQCPDGGAHHFESARPINHLGYWSQKRCLSCSAAQFNNPGMQKVKKATGVIYQKSDCL